MNIFISWSGELSRKIAAELSNWLPKVIQTIKPFYSPNDIGVGNRWFSEIEIHLSSSQFGILCVTDENVISSWLMFEAGALSKNIGQSRVVPVLFGINHTDITGPLAQFQAIKFNKEEVNHFIQNVNSLSLEPSIPNSIVSETFEKWWPDLEKTVSELLANPFNKKAVKKYSQAEVLEEILGRTRQLTNEVKGRKLTVHPDAAKELIGYYLDVCNALCNYAEDPAKSPLPIEYIYVIIGRITFIERALLHLLEQTEIPTEVFVGLQKEFEETKQRIRRTFHQITKQLFK